jgi:hypothetical protein
MSSEVADIMLATARTVSASWPTLVEVADTMFASTRTMSATFGVGHVAKW